MSTAVIVDYRDISYPLSLLLNREGVGGIVGKSPVVALRHEDDYLDWDDDVFKPSGWVLKNAPMTEVGGGYYELLVDLPSINAKVGDVYIAEYTVNDGGDVRGAAQDIVAVTAINDLDFLRKMSTNRMEQYPGNPGTLILYDDDNATPVMSWQLRDASGGGIVAVVGASSRRSVGT
jgi:hypothetical protein